MNGLPSMPARPFNVILMLKGLAVAMKVSCCRRKPFWCPKEGAPGSVSEDVVVDERSGEAVGIVAEGGRIASLRGQRRHIVWQFDGGFYGIWSHGDDGEGIASVGGVEEPSASAAFGLGLNLDGDVRLDAEDEILK